METEEYLELLIKTLTGKEFKIKVNSRCTVAELMKVIPDRTDLYDI